MDEFLQLVEQNPDSMEICVDLLPRLSAAQIQGGVRRNPERGRAIVQALDVDRVSQKWDYRQFRWADHVELALLYVAAVAATMDDLPLLDEATRALFAWDGSWDQWPPQGPIRQWLAGLTGAAAGVVAQALEDEPKSARHFEVVSSNVLADPRIRQAVRP